MRSSELELRRGVRLDAGPLDYAPENELGVVFLFSYLARRAWGLRVELIRSGFPDCIAYRGDKRLRIEFEYRSRHFAQHRHDPKECDWIVCWIHDWPAVPRRLEVKELRKEFGVGFNVWIQPVRGEYSDAIGSYDRADWSVAASASPGDLVLFYRTRPHACIEDIFRISSAVRFDKKTNWREGSDFSAAIRRVCRLAAPLHLEDLQNHKLLSRAGFVRGRLQGRPRVSAYWPTLYRMILERNPGLRKTLAGYGPERLD